MAKNFRTLEERMSKESSARAQARAEKLLAEERTASIRDLVSGMEASFAEVKESASEEGRDVPPTSEAELERLVGDALRKSRIFSN